MQPVEIIVCVECGGRAHLLYVPDPESPFVEGDYSVVAGRADEPQYRCEECMDRFDLEVTAEDVADEERGAPEF